MDPDAAWGGVQVAYSDLRHAIDVRDQALAVESAAVLAGAAKALAKHLAGGAPLPGGPRPT